MKNFRYFKMMNAMLCLLAVLFHGVAGVPLPVAETGAALTTASTEDGEANDSGESLESQVQAYLLQYGYMTGKSKNSFSSSSSSSELAEALKKLQKFAGLSVTGKIDKDTLELMETPRCQLPDTRAVKGLRKRFVIGAKWSTNTLTYDVTSYPSGSFNMKEKKLVDETIATSFKDWTDVTNLSIERSSTNPSVKIDFYAKDHGDGFPFDGRGRVLAHAFLPPYGQLHFDDDETWSLSSFGGPNLRQVGTHEIGHILGLEHSPDRKAVMFPYYSYNYNFKLGDDDINGIRFLYGSPGTTTSIFLQNLLPVELITSTTPTTTTTTTTTPAPTTTKTSTTTTSATTTTTTTKPPTTTTTTTTTKPPTTTTTTTTTTKPPTTTTTTTTTTLPTTKTTLPTTTTTTSTTTVIPTTTTKTTTTTLPTSTTTTTLPTTSTTTTSTTSTTTTIMTPTSVKVPTSSSSSVIYWWQWKQWN